MKMTDIEQAAICLDSFLRTEQAKSAVCTDCNEMHLRPVDFSEVKIAFDLICKEMRRDNQEYAKLLE